MRLNDEIGDLSRRGNLNLVVGVLITATASVVLIYLVTRSHGDFVGIAAVLSYYIPRVTTIALIETFAYFFLGLYKSSLAEIKYYQNERTTLVAVEIAWRASLATTVGNATADVIGQIVRIDRNQKGVGPSKEEATPSPEMLSIAKEAIKSLAESIKQK